MGFNFLINFFSSFGGVNFETVVFSLEGLDNGFGLVFKSIQSLFDGVRVVISPSTSFGSFHNSIDEDLRGTVEIDEVSNDDAINELLFELIPVLLITGKPVQKIASVAVFLDGILHKANDKFGG